MMFCAQILESRKLNGEPGPYFAALYNYAYSYYFDIHIRWFIVRNI